MSVPDVGMAVLVCLLHLGCVMGRVSRRQILPVDRYGAANRGSSPPRTPSFRC